MDCKILVVHRDPIIRAGLRALVQRRLHAPLIAEAGSLHDALGLLDERPALVLVENTPGTIAGLATLLAHASTRVVVFSRVDDAAALQAGVTAGIMGFCVYDGEHVEPLLDIVVKVAAGDYGFDPISTRRLVADCRAIWQSNGEGTITPEELAVFRYVAAGANTVQVAAALSVSAATVRNRAAKVLRKLRVRTRPAAVMKLVASGHLTSGSVPAAQTGLAEYAHAATEATVTAAPRAA
jgi:DNA-binding NarL/FixJ family response regulator